MSPEAMQELHGILRNPHADAGSRPCSLRESEVTRQRRAGFGELDEQMRAAGLIPEIPEGVDWWDPLADNAVRPDVDAVLVNGVRVSAGSRVRLRPGRRADAQDIFFAGKTARVISVHEDVDGEQYVGVVVEDDPDFEMPDSYGRYLYFAPDEVEPLEARSSAQIGVHDGCNWLGRKRCRCRRGRGGSAGRTPVVPDVQRYLKMRNM